MTIKAIRLTNENLAAIDNNSDFNSPQRFEIKMMQNDFASPEGFNLYIVTYGSCATDDFRYEMIEGDEAFLAQWINPLEATDDFVIISN